MASQLWAKRIALAGIGVFGLLQLVPVRRDNPPVISSQTIFATREVPAPVRSILQNSCANCHSNETVWPWYSRIAPASWVVANDVHAGRRHMNFSTWADYSPEKQDHELEQICEKLMNEEMPDSKYAFVHRGARITEAQRDTVCEWTQSPQ